MYKGYLKKIEGNGFNEAQIQKKLQEAGIISEVRLAHSLGSLNILPKPKKVSTWKRITNLFFRKKEAENSPTPKYRPFEATTGAQQLIQPYKNVYYTAEFKTELYNYLVNLFDGLIKLNFHKLVGTLSKEIEVYDDEKHQREIIKRIFVQTFREAVGNESILVNDISNDSTLPDQQSYFSRLKKCHTQLMDSLKNYPELVESYLKGDEQRIERKLLETCKVIEEIIDFEFRYRFLKALNKEYEIENIEVNEVEPKYLELYKRYESIFNSVEILVFTHQKIESFEKHIPAHVSSLFYALVEQNCITDNRTSFQKYVFDVHGKKVSKIRRDPKHGNTPFKQRLTQFKIEIKENIPSKTN